MEHSYQQIKKNTNEIGRNTLNLDIGLNMLTQWLSDSIKRKFLKRHSSFIVKKCDIFNNMTFSHKFLDLPAKIIPMIMQPHFQNQNFLTNPSRYFSKISKPLFWRGCMPWVVVSSCKSYFILKAYRTYMHYITQRKLSFKSKLTNYLKQIPLNTQRFTAFLQVGATLFRKFLNFTIHFEQSFNFTFHCSNRCWIYVTIYPLQWYNNGTFIEIIYFFTSVLGSLCH